MVSASGLQDCMSGCTVDSNRMVPVTENAGGEHVRTMQPNREPVKNEADSLASVQAELQRQPHILLKLAENSLTVAKSLRDNYFKNTAHFVSDVRRAVHHAQKGAQTRTNSRRH